MGCWVREGAVLWCIGPGEARVFGEDQAEESVAGVLSGLFQQEAKSEVGLPGDCPLGKGPLVGTWTRDATIQVMNTREGAQPGALKTSPKKRVSVTICQTQRPCWKTSSH